jgi:hypothetical protein
MITNAGYKAVGIDGATPSGTMTVHSLTVASPPGALNNLLLNYPGTGTPLRIQNDFTLSTNGLLQNFYGSVQVDGSSGGIFAINSAEFDQEGGLTVITPMTRLTAGIVNATNAVMNLGALQIRAWRPLDHGHLQSCFGGP